MTLKSEVCLPNLFSIFQAGFNAPVTRHLCPIGGDHSYSYKKCIILHITQKFKLCLSLIEPMYMLHTSDDVCFISSYLYSKHPDFCRRGESETFDPVKDELTGAYLTCDALTKSGCPPGHTCGFIAHQLDAVGKRGFCCPDFGKSCISCIVLRNRLLNPHKKKMDNWMRSPWPLQLVLLVLVMVFSLSFSFLIAN